MFTFTDDALAQVIDQVLIHPPERGGALLGPPNVPVVTAFLLDPDAETSTASFVPSRQLTERVRKFESVSGLQLKGVLHSHPGGLDRPSGPDRVAVGKGLEANPHLANYVCPIVTTRSDVFTYNKNGTTNGHSTLADHEIPLPGGKVSCFVGRRLRGGHLELVETAATVLPVRRDAERAANHLHAESVADLGMVEIEGRTMLARQIRLAGNVEITLLFGLDYPVRPPAVMLSIGDTDTENLDLKWSLSQPASERLVNALSEHFRVDGDGNYRRAWGPKNGDSMTHDAKVGSIAGWTPVVTTADADNRASEKRDAALARTRDLLPPEVSQKLVLVVGDGSVGSYIAEQLVRSGTGKIALQDPDNVELANLSRSCYRLGDVGMKKPHALARHLLNINPTLKVETHVVAVQDMGVAALADLVSAADMIIATTDDPQAQFALNRFAYGYGKPAIFVGLYAGAKGGEVVMSIPDRTACFQCATNFRRSMEREAGGVSRRTDYGSGRLVGEVALGVDVHHVASAATKLALSLMLPPGTKGSLAELAENAIAAGTPYLLMGMTPNYWFFKDVFHATPGQHAFQSIWAGVERDQECSVCGLESARIDPRQIPLKTLATASILNAMAPAGGA